MNLAEQLQGTPVWSLVTSLSRLDRARRAAELRAGLGVADQRLMWLFSDREPRTLKQIADALSLEQSTVNRQVNTAIAEGLLRRYREPGHAAKLLAATDDGLDRFSADLRANISHYEAALAAIPADERDRFLSQLADFTDAYEGEHA